jgi:hypothetical protein
MRSMIFLLMAAGCSNSHADRHPAAPEADSGAAIADSGTDAGMIVIAEDAGPGPGADGIACGTGTCDLATEGCLASCLYATDERMPACIATEGDGRWPARECPTGLEMFPRYWLRCDGPEDCPPSESCNMIYGSLGQYTYCGPRESSDPLCHRDADCPAAAPLCRPNADLPGYSTCVGP